MKVQETPSISQAEANAIFTGIPIQMVRITTVATSTTENLVFTEVILIVAVTSICLIVCSKHLSQQLCYEKLDSLVRQSS